ncbi:hypothetical protein AV955_gp043 [Diadromus pulchellus ascovirus 4a]|uniref:Complete DpAV4 genome n=2 Tax=Diadromus pulchellus ascovirus 4a TaxID=158683 RepID=F2NYX2_9VIRU|nr:hypothetical protein AV955_gp043 [Diadromus pulchellus ascovirus 4a]CCA61400.1 unnamed protein product [Diadromus pulchellus ascovirus 4a]
MAIITKSALIERTTEDAADHGIRITDELDGLENFCADMPPTTDLERKVRGVVFDGDKLVFRSSPFPTPGLPESLDGFKVFTMKEGTVIRVFFHNTKWYVSSNRKLDAFKSKWGAISFGEIFFNTVEKLLGKSKDEFLESLDKSIGYLFRMGTIPSTRIVAPAGYDLEILNSFDMNSGSEKIDENLSSLYSNTKQFSNLKDVEEYVENMQMPFSDGYGVFLYNPDACFKLENSTYKKLSELRHNVSSIPFAYLHNCFDENNNKKFRDLYPEHVETFDFYDSEINAISANLLNVYIKIHVDKQKIEVSKQEHHVLYHVHGKYLSSRQPTTLQTVYGVITGMPPSIINKIIALRKQDRKKAQKV